MIYTTLTLNDMINMMRQVGRDNFSLEAYEVIYDYLNEEVDGFEFYPVDVDSVFMEYNSHGDFILDYQDENDDDIFNLWKLNNGSYLVQHT